MGWLSFPNRNSMTVAKQRFEYIDQFRGFIGILMLLGHCSYYLNSVWKQLDPFDPLFPTWGQFALRYAGYLCAPGFLMMAGAMVWLSYTRSVEKGTTPRAARWYFVQRGLFLVLVQMIWVNASWGGFRALNLWHLGIISTIGISMIFLTTLVSTRWHYRLVLALVLLFAYPFMLHIQYDTTIDWQRVIMETFLTAGDFNKYPVIPWFALALLGSVMANFWFTIWESDKKRIFYGLSIALSAIALSFVVRLSAGYGNIFPHSGFDTLSFFVDQKYPPSLFHHLFFFGLVVTGVTLFLVLNRVAPKITRLFSIPGKVPMFFYAIHLAILGIFVKRLDFFYLEGGIWATFIGFAIMLAVMLPLSAWFYKVKAKSRNFIIRMI
jgi:uncharacterized membrane protein